MLRSSSITSYIIMIDRTLYSDLNLPLSGVAFILVAIFLRVRTPGGSLREKLSRIDLVYVRDLLRLLRCL